MKRLSICLLIVWLWMMRPADAQTRTLGWTSVVVGGALIAASFNYKRDCDGYRSRYEGGFSEGYRVYDYCTTLTDRTATTKDTPWDISLARPALLYSGIAALTGGILVATVWADAPVAVSPMRGGIHVGASFGF